jgi:hypothetical protein
VARSARGAEISARFNADDGNGRDRPTRAITA